MKEIKKIAPYQPISCDYYDHLEIWAMRKTPVTIIYKNEGEEELTIESVIKTLKTLNKEEFVVLTSGQEIRLDRLISINGQVVVLSCGI